MMLTDLLDAVATTGTLTKKPAALQEQLPSYKTSIGYLARALKCPDGAQHCPQEIFALSQQELRHALDIYLGSLDPAPTSHTIRNTRYNIRTLFKKAYELHILEPRGHLPTLPLSAPTREKALRAVSLYKKHYNNPSYTLPLEAWPAEIVTFWSRYTTEKQRTVRPVTLKRRKDSLASYLGYLHNIVHEPATFWDDLFNVDRLDAFVLWHSARLGVRFSVHASMVVEHLITLAAHFKHAQSQALKDYRRTLDPPEPMHNKHNFLLSRADLERVALSELQDAHKALVTFRDTRRPVKHPGANRASQHRRALVLRLLLRIPLRQRNICEMQLDRNLYRDAQGHWWLSFQGEQLKVSRRNRKINTVSYDLTQYFSDIVEHLEEYLNDFRPRLPNASTSPYVFLTRYGNPYDTMTLHRDFMMLIFKRTGKRCYPHLLRTLWTSEFYAAGGKPATAAYMLNDSPQTALKHYFEFQDDIHLQEASAFNQKLGT